MITVKLELGSRCRCNRDLLYSTIMSISKSASKKVNFDHFKEADGEITFKFPSSKRSAMAHDDDDEVDEDDEAPDDVSFESSNKLVKQIEKGIKDQIEHEDQIRKGKIRQRQALYLQQKQEKLATLNEKLPSDVLKAVARKSKETPKEIAKSKPGVKQKIKPKPKNAGTKKKSLKKVADGDYVPLETKTTKFHIRLVESELQAASKVPKNLINFKQKMLERNMKREPVEQYLAKMNAKRISNVPPTAKIPVKLLENVL